MPFKYFTKVLTSKNSKISVNTLDTAYRFLYTRINFIIDPKVMMGKLYAYHRL